MASKRVMIIGEHPLTADARRQYASNGYEIVGTEAESSVPDEVFIATSPKGDAFAEDNSNICTIRNICQNAKHSGMLRVQLLLHSSDTLALFRQRDICGDLRDTAEIFPFTMESLWGERIFSGFPGIGNEYPPIDREPVTRDSDRTAHIVIFGMNPMSEAIAMHAALTCHYPNFIRNHSLKTRITIIDEGMDEKRDVFINKNAALFENSFYRFIDLNINDGTGVSFIHKPTWAGKQEDFVDIEWEFVTGRAADRKLRSKLVLWSVSQRKLLNLFLCHDNTGDNIR